MRTALNNGHYIFDPAPVPPPGQSSSLGLKFKGANADLESRAEHCMIICKLLKRIATGDVSKIEGFARYHATTIASLDQDNQDKLLSAARNCGNDEVAVFIEEAVGAVVPLQEALAPTALRLAA